MIRTRRRHLRRRGRYKSTQGAAQRVRRRTRMLLSEPGDEAITSHDSRSTQNVCKARGMGMSTRRSRRVEATAQEPIGTSRRRREASRAIGTARAMVAASDMKCGDAKRAKTTCGGLGYFVHPSASYHPVFTDRFTDWRVSKIRIQYEAVGIVHSRRHWRSR